MRIGVEDTIECKKCKKISKASDWDMKTFMDCNTREMRRDYIGLSDSRAYKKSTGTWYKCPCCEEYSAGYTLKIERQDKDEDRR